MHRQKKIGWCGHPMYVTKNRITQMVGNKKKYTIFEILSAQFQIIANYFVFYSI